MGAVAELIGGDLVPAPGCPLPRRGGHRSGQGHPGHACPVCLTGALRAQPAQNRRAGPEPRESSAPSWQDRGSLPSFYEANDPRSFVRGCLRHPGLHASRSRSSRAPTPARRRRPAVGGGPARVPEDRYRSPLTQDSQESRDTLDGVPFFPLRPDLPRKYFILSYW